MAGRGNNLFGHAIRDQVRRFTLGACFDEYLIQPGSYSLHALQDGRLNAVPQNLQRKAELRGNTDSRPGAASAEATSAFKPRPRRGRRIGRSF